MGARVDLFDAAAERAAQASGRAKSQERVEILHPDRAEDWGALWACLCGAELHDVRGACPECGQ